MFVTIVAANVSVLVVGSIPTGIALREKIPLAWAYKPKHCISKLTPSHSDVQTVLS